MPRGGKRPGAGAPRKNFNALKTGRYTPRLYLLVLYLLANPFIRMCFNSLYSNLLKHGYFLKPTRPAHLVTPSTQPTQRTQ